MTQRKIQQLEEKVFENLKINHFFFKWFTKNC
jgi:hypothetical protein